MTTPDPRALPDYDALDALVDEDPIALRDVAWQLRARVAEVEVERDEAFARANDAARLSAEARDETDSWRKDFATLKEFCGTLERDRTERDGWTLETAARHGLTAGWEDPWGALPGLYPLIGRLLDQQRARVAAYERLETAVRQWSSHRLDSDAIHAVLAAIAALPAPEVSP